MAQYVFWTGDEEGVAKAVEEFIQKGMVSALRFLYNLDGVKKKQFTRGGDRRVLTH